MAKKKPSEKISKFGQESKDLAEFENKLNRLFKKYKNIRQVNSLINNLTQNNVSLSQSLTKQQQDILDSKVQQLQNTRSTNVELNKQSRIYSGISNVVSGLYNYLESADSVIKETSLNLGLSAQLSAQLRDNLIESSTYSARLGTSISQLASAQKAYADEVGRATVLSEKSLKAIAQIGQGTSLGVENAGQLVGQFRLLGLNAENTRDFIQDTLNDTSNLGINLNKVLLNVSSNLKTIQTYNFSNGVDAIKDMAIYSEMFKISISDAFASMDIARTLEGAVDMSAKLMVMGGEFTRQNPFEIAFLARNKPEEYMRKLNQMTKGLYYFNQEAGQFETSAFDLDRLRAVAEATGIPFQNLVEQSRRLAEINYAKSQLIGFTDNDRDFIANMAELNAQTGKFEIKIGNKFINDIESLTTGQLEVLRTEKETLEQIGRAHV